MKRSFLFILAAACLFMFTRCGSVTKYKVTIQSIPSNGGTVNKSSGKYAAGTKLKLKAIPANDTWRFDHWSGSEGFTITDPTDPTITATVKKDMNIIAVFVKKQYELTVHTKPKGGGTVKQKIIEVAAKTTKEYDAGTTVQLTAKPANGWKFVKWTGDISSNKNPITITIKSPKEVTAVFKYTGNTFHLAPNGVTVVCNDANFGDVGVVNGVTYTKRRANLITPENASTTCTSGVTDMSHLFDMSAAQKQTISKRNLKLAVSSNYTAGAANSNSSSISDITTWDVSNVTDMSFMFAGADAFNQDISHWDVGKVTNMKAMFFKASSFNKPIGGWDVSNVTNMALMFYGAKSFDKPLNNWDVGNVTNMNAMFYNSQSFNQSIGDWNVSSVKNMAFMFRGATSFNKPIGHWNVGNVTNMKAMFNAASSFNQKIGKWDVSNVRNMFGMFAVAKSFDKPIGGWLVFNVTKMGKMFLNASSFNQDISGWCVSKIPTKPTKFAKGSPLTQAHRPNWGTCHINANGITDARLTQSTQNPDHNVPMAAGRDAALLIFFKTGSSSNRYSNVGQFAYAQQGSGKFSYKVTAKLYHRGGLVKKITIPAGTKALLPINQTHAIMTIGVPGKYVKPGLSIKVKTSNGWSYTLNPITVKKVAEFHVSLIPIHVTATGKTGDVNKQNKDEYMEAALDMYPINDYIAKVHDPLNVSADPTSTSQGNFYSEVLKEVRTTWIAEGKPDYYYYGVIPQNTGGVVGLGYVDEPQPHTYRQAVGWDYPGWKYRSETMAHEIGHNMGRNHAPCGNPSMVDRNYPYANALIGVYGYEVDQGQLKDPNIYHDLMSYCKPVWISDYTYKGVFKFREEANSSASMNQSPQDVLLVWGEITNNKLTLEPAFRIEAPATMPQKSGPFTLSGYDKNGNRLFSFSFAGARVAGLKNTRQFAFAIPVGRVDIKQLQTIRLNGRSLKAMQQTNAGTQIAQMKTTKPQVAASRVSWNTVSIRWNDSQYQMALIKNPRTGEVIGFMNNGTTNIVSNASRLKIYFSDGVKTVTKTVNVR